MLFTENHKEDLINTFVAISAFTESFSKTGVIVDKIDVDSFLLENTITNMREDFPSNDGTGFEQASAFKKLSNFICCFMFCKPLQGISFEESDYRDNPYKNYIKQHLNASFAAYYMVHILKDVEIVEDNGNKLIANNSIAITQHSFIGLVESLSVSKITPESHWAILSLLIEQLVYKSNPQCQYEDFAYGDQEYIDFVKKSKKSIDGGMYSEFQPD